MTFEDSWLPHRLGLLTDLYELRMVESYLANGMTQDATFSLFVRPAAQRPWLVALGVGHVLDLLDQLAFTESELTYLASLGVGPETRDYLASVHVSGEVRAVPEGTLLLAQEPVLEITAPMPIAQLLETAVMNVVHYPTQVATKAARCALAAQGRRLADFGFRRAHGLETGIEAARAAFVGGGFATSNLEAGRRHGIPVTGTMAHSYVQAFDDEREAFRTFATDHPDHSTLLVDTYDTLTGVERAIEVCHDLGIAPQGIRLDSGDLGPLASRTRELLDDAGFEDTIVIVSGGIDEHRIARLVDESRPIDGFGVGTSLTTASDYPGLDIVYKLVAFDDRPVAKFSGAKSTFPGPKQVFRPESGIVDDVLTVHGATEAGGPLLQPVWRDGERLSPAADLHGLRARVQAGLDALPTEWRTLPEFAEVPVPVVGDALRDLNETVRRTAFDPTSS
jgi:nicotinate phosphoribosyltransferase